MQMNQRFLYVTVQSYHASVEGLHIHKYGGSLNPAQVYRIEMIVDNGIIGR